MALIHLIYVSSARQLFSDSELTELLIKARHSNETRRVSGLLLYSEGNFMQVLEGEEEDVDAIYAKIKADPRHANLFLIAREPIAERAFADWQMGFRNLSGAPVDQLAGYNRFFSEQGKPGASQDNNLAMSLLKGFASNNP